MPKETAYRVISKPKQFHYRFLGLSGFGFGRKESTSTVIVEWRLDGTTFEPVKMNRRETKFRYGLFEKYFYQDTPISADKE